MRIVGLTGGISSGKSTVSNLFKSHGIPVVDADVVARAALDKGTSGWRKVVAAFGQEILLDNAEVNRLRLGQIVFSDPDKRQLLNRLLAPHISSGIFWEIVKLWMKGHKIIVLDVPLLFEAKMDKFTKPIIVVWVDPETQIQRLMARDESIEEDARNRVNAQMSLDLKRCKADIIIDNSGSLDDLNEKFQKVLSEVSKPLTWIEFWRSGQGGLTAFALVTLCVLLFRKAFNPFLAPQISSGIFWEIVKLCWKGHKIIVLDAPLLFEAKMDKFTKPVIVVWVDLETQIQRLKARDGSIEEDVRNKINAQMSLAVKRSKADIIIDNPGSLDDLNEQFQKVSSEGSQNL
ncbi:hypothetical protein K1719_000071 [Acacia pycnantha]|nr:hypothetical protein K1719_000071 [Acacia pycnantha]